MNHLFFSLLLLLPLSLCQDGAPFDYLMFTSIYPTAVCRADDDTVPDSCEIPDGTPQWSIHGLWPNFDNGSYPQNCHGTPRTFDEKLIKEIEPELRKVWPNLYPGKSIESFWKHEYDKHGTCAQSDERFKTELLYFTEVIKVFHSIDIATGMSSIGPSDKPITRQDLLNAVMKVTGGKTFQFNCLRDKKTKQVLLGDIRVCLNKDLTIRNCPDHGKEWRATNRVGHRFERSSGRGKQPLPRFQPCPAEFIYLSPTSSAKSSFFGSIWKAIKSIGS